MSVEYCQADSNKVPEDPNMFDDEVEDGVLTVESDIIIITDEQITLAITGQRTLDFPVVRFCTIAMVDVMYRRIETWFVGDRSCSWLYTPRFKADIF